MGGIDPEKPYRGTILEENSFQFKWKALPTIQAPRRYREARAQEQQFPLPTCPGHILKHRAYKQFNEKAMISLM